MTTYVNLTAPVTRDDVFAAISDAQDIGDRVVVALNGICSRAEDWLSSKVIYGNYGDIIVAQTGEVLLYEPSEDARDDPAGAYHDIVHVEIDKWRHRHGFTWSEVGQVHRHPDGGVPHRERALRTSDRLRWVPRRGGSMIRFLLAAAALAPTPAFAAMYNIDGPAGTVGIVPLLIAAYLWDKLRGGNGS